MSTVGAQNVAAFRTCPVAHRCAPLQKDEDEIEMIEQEITLSEILIAREERVAIQNVLLGQYKVPVISFTMNMAGPVKVTALSRRAFLWGCRQLRLGFVQNKFPVLAEKRRNLPTGDEAYFAIDAPAETVKALCVEIEESSGMGRLYDMDVIGLDGHKLERGAERPCIVCGKPGRGCASRRVHTAAEVREAADHLLEGSIGLRDRALIAQFATRALLEEVAVTPKPGLVDRANNGAHKDMDFSTFQASAAALPRYWGVCFGRGRAGGPHGDPELPETPSDTFASLRPLGKKAELTMLAATGGVNTHKGVIFTLGVLCGAIGRRWTAEAGFPSVDIILSEAAAMTRETLARELPAARWNTAGEALYRQYGTRGIRGEVSDGLPAVGEISLPVFKKLLAEGLDRNHAAAVTLLHLVAKVEDTNLLHRGGPEGAAWAKQAAAALIGVRWDEQCLSLHRIPSLEEIAELDRQFIARNLSPGGCADLLAVTLFLEQLEKAGL